MQEFISFQAAREIVLQSVSPCGIEEVHLKDAFRRTLAEDIVSSADIPPFDNSAMDGYAVRTTDLPTSGSVLELAGEVAAGDGRAVHVRPGTCIRIMTGAPIPQGADAVVPVEKTSIEDGRVRFEMVPAARDHVRAAGSDLQRGERVIGAGRVVAPPDVGVMASLGYARIRVARRPTVAVLTTGNELVDVSAVPGPGQIRDSNGPALSAQVASAGGVLMRRLHARDDRAEIRAALERAIEADVLVVSGGVSVGTYDLVKDELVGMGMDLLFWKVRQKPGKPLAFGLLDNKPVFGLPGNPVSSSVCFDQYVRPALAGMMDRTENPRTHATGVLTRQTPKKAGLHYFARGTAAWMDGRLEIEPAAHQGSHVASSLVRSNGYIHLPEMLDDAPAGLPVDFEWFDW